MPQPEKRDLDYREFVEAALERSEHNGFRHVEAMRVIFMLSRVASLITYDLEASVHRPRGLTWPGFRLLVVLGASGPLEATTAAEQSGMSKQAVSALVKNLVRDGLVAREASPRDRRAVSLSLTKRGREVFADAKAANNEREKLWCEGLTSTERHELVGLLLKLLHREMEGEARRRS